jgi:hypothetical protein
MMQMAESPSAVPPYRLPRGDEKKVRTHVGTSFS